MVIMTIYSHYKNAAHDEAVENEDKVSLFLAHLMLKNSGRCPSENVSPPFTSLDAKTISVGHPEAGFEEQMWDRNLQQGSRT
jgi:hypothetical protein